MKRSVWLKVIAISLLFASTVFFQNCGQVEFASMLSKAEQERQKQCVNGCWISHFNPEEHVIKPEIKVMLVVDNSYSMTQAQEKVAAGVANLIDGIKGFSASYHLYTTTQTGDKNAAQLVKGCRIEKNGATTIEPTCPAAGARELGAVYTDFEKWELAPSLVSGTEFQIKEDSPDSKFQELREKLAEAVASPTKGVGTSGNDSERGICTLLRAVYEDGANRIFNPGDVAVFGLISDEDDFSTAANCFSKTETKTDCTEEDKTPVKKTKPVQCTKPECTTFTTNYSVVLGARSYTRKTVTYSRERNPYFIRKLYWREQAPQTYKESVHFEYDVTPPAKDNVPQPPVTYPKDITRDVTNACVAASGSCSASQISWAQSTATSLGGVYKANSCVLNSCVANATPPVTPKGPTTLSSEANCNAMTEATCKSKIGNPANYMAGTCDASECNAGTPTVEPNRTHTAADVENNQCTAGGCDSATIAAINPGSGWSYVANSCKVICDPKNLAGTTVPYPIVQPTNDAATNSSNSYCNKTYQGYTNLGAYASANNGGRPVTGCQVVSVGPAQYATVNEPYDEYPPAGTPKCVTNATQQFGFPNDGVLNPSADLREAFVSRSKSLFESNYFVSSIIHTSSNDPNCPILPGQSEGLRYSGLVSLVPKLGATNSVCDKDYGTAFSNVSKWVQRSMDNTFKAPDVDESKHEVIEVWVDRNGAKVEIPPEAFTVSGGTIKFLQEDFLQPGDKIEYLVRNK